LEIAKCGRLFPAFWLAANTGMRRGELLGLRWKDLDLTAGHLSISPSLVSVAYKLHERDYTPTHRAPNSWDESAV
jgi:integrase